jgi:hypothetical protein
MIFQLSQHQYWKTNLPEFFEIFSHTSTLFNEDVGEVAISKLARISADSPNIKQNLDRLSKLFLMSHSHSQVLDSSNPRPSFIFFLRSKESFAYAEIKKKTVTFLAALIPKLLSQTPLSYFRPLKAQKRSPSDPQDNIDPPEKFFLPESAALVELQNWTLKCEKLLNPIPKKKKKTTSKENINFKFAGRYRNTNIDTKVNTIEENDACA